MFSNLSTVAKISLTSSIRSSSPFLLKSLTTSICPQILRFSSSSSSSGPTPPITRNKLKRSISGVKSPKIAESPSEGPLGSTEKEAMNLANDSAQEGNNSNLQQQKLKTNDKIKQESNDYSWLPKVPETDYMNNSEFLTQSLYSGYRPVTIQSPNMNKPSSSSNRDLYKISMYNLDNSYPQPSRWSTSATGIESYPEWNNVPKKIANNLRPYKLSIPKYKIVTSNEVNKQMEEREAASFFNNEENNINNNNIKGRNNFNETNGVSYRGRFRFTRTVDSITGRKRIQLQRRRVSNTIKHNKHKNKNDHDHDQNE